MSTTTPLKALSSSDLPVIVHVVNGLRFGGNESLCLELLRHAPPQVQNVLLNLDATHQEMLPLFEQVPGLSIDHLKTPTHPRLPFLRAVYQSLQQWHPQVVLIYPFGLHLLVGLAARLAQVPMVGTRAGNPPPAPGHPDRWKWQTILSLSRLLKIPVYSCSHMVHEALQSLQPLPAGSLPIPNGCDVAAIAHQVATQRRQKREGVPLVIGMVARLNAIKDHRTLIRAFGQLSITYPDVVLWLVGDGEERPALEQLCQALGLTGRVKFWGTCSNVPELLGQMDIYVFSTTAAEGFGIAVIEAMAAALPIVASDVAACREVLGHGAAGILVPPQDSTAMARALATLMQAAPLRKQWGQLAYQRAVQHYTMEICADRWYAHLLPQGGGA